MSLVDPADAEVTPVAGAATPAYAAASAASCAKYSLVALFCCVGEYLPQFSGGIVGGRVVPADFLTGPRPLKGSRPISAGVCTRRKTPEGCHRRLWDGCWGEAVAYTTSTITAAPRRSWNVNININIIQGFDFFNF